MHPTMDYQLTEHKYYIIINTMNMITSISVIISSIVAIAIIISITSIIVVLLGIWI